MSDTKAFDLDAVAALLRRADEEGGVAWTMLVQSQRTIERVDPDAVDGCWRLFLGPGSAFEIGRTVEVLEHLTVVLSADAESILIPALTDVEREPGDIVGHPVIARAMDRYAPAVKRQSEV